MRTLVLLGLIVALLALPGCGGGDKPKLVAVTGRVVRDGQPVVPGVLTFHPPPGVTYNGDRPSCVLAADGGFAVKTYPHGEGAPPGSYKVTLPADLAARLKKPAYADPAKTPWTVEVPDAGLRDYLLEVK